jgi:hypothetical protein
MAERHERIEGWGLRGFDQSWRKQIGCGAGVEVEEVSADCDTEMLLAFVFEGSIGEVHEGEVCRGLIRFGEPALVRIRGSFGHGE